MGVKRENGVFLFDLGVYVLLTVITAGLDMITRAITCHFLPCSGRADGVQVNRASGAAICAVEHGKRVTKKAGQQ